MSSPFSRRCVAKGGAACAEPSDCPQASHGGDKELLALDLYAGRFNSHPRPSVSSAVNKVRRWRTEGTADYADDTDDLGPPRGDRPSCQGAAEPVARQRFRL